MLLRHFRSSSRRTSLAPKSCLSKEWSQDESITRADLAHFASHSLDINPHRRETNRLPPSCRSLGTTSRSASHRPCSRARHLRCVQAAASTSQGRWSLQSASVRLRSRNGALPPSRCDRVCLLVARSVATPTRVYHGGHTNNGNHIHYQPFHRLFPSFQSLPRSLLAPAHVLST